MANCACDSCKKRKVRCDSAEPCANCRIAHIVCQYTVPSKKRGPKTAQKQKHARRSCPGTNLPGAQKNLQDAVPIEPLQLQESLVSPGNPHSSPQSRQLPSKITLMAAEDTTQTTSSARSAQVIWDSLLVSIKVALPLMSVVDIADSCIDLYMQYTFPTAPIIYEPTLRRDALIFFSEMSSVEVFSSYDEDQRVAHMRAFTLVTAIWGSMASLMLASLLHYGHLVDSLFLRAS